ncbi:hypothetical protein MAR_016160 [Mya arenaria]|uniref:Uncharacterized protein n=1 Tax=Mya arenaria TaxID=6604 RepID=A0ABY7FMM7_MYAAR|nr:hypothetical protein MAR_016160 [Mya arenaria]
MSQVLPLLNVFVGLISVDGNLVRPVCNGTIRTLTTRGCNTSGRRTQHFTEHLTNIREGAEHLYVQYSNTADDFITLHKIASVISFVHDTETDDIFLAKMTSLQHHVFKSLCYLYQKGTSCGLLLPFHVHMDTVSHSNCDVGDNLLIKYTRDMQLFKRMAENAREIVYRYTCGDNCGKKR